MFCVCPPLHICTSHKKCHTKGPGSIPDSMVVHAHDTATPHFKWRNQWMVTACKERPIFTFKYGCPEAFRVAALPPTPEPPTPAPTMSFGQRQEAALMASLAGSFGHNGK